MTFIMLLHIGVGLLAVTSGLMALLVTKGATRHRAAGRWFVGSMAITSVLGAIAAYQLSQALTLLGAIFTLYLLATAILTMRRRPNTVGGAEQWLCVAGFAIGCLSAVWAYQALHAPDGLKDGFAAELYGFFAVLSVIMASADLIVIRKGGLSGSARLARHLWRSCYAMFIAVGSLFTGPGAGVFPEGLRASGLLSIPEAAVFLTMGYWLARVWWQSRSAGSRD